LKSSLAPPLAKKPYWLELQLVRRVRLELNVHQVFAPVACVLAKPTERHVLQTRNVFRLPIAPRRARLVLLSVAPVLVQVNTNVLSVRPALIRPVSGSALLLLVAIALVLRFANLVLPASS
jgi:hypothetical protein